MNMKYKIAYVCVHNSCRSQIAEAITKLEYADFFDAYSGGTETKPQINQDAVRMIKDIYGYDMNIHQKSKLIDDIPEDLDILVTMGCHVECPTLPCRHREDWGLDDPTGLGDEMMAQTIQLIQEKIMDIKKRIENHELFK